MRILDLICRSLKQKRVDRLTGVHCSTKKRTFISNKWSIEPLVRFTSTNTSSHEFKGSCTVDNFKALKKNYVVKFFSIVGPKAENLIAGCAVGCKSVYKSLFWLIVFNSIM